MEFLTTLIAFAVTIGILVVIHEYGHYWVARKCGVKVLSFSIGFGSTFYKWKRKNDPDQVEWKISALPLGGYVRMLDERDPECLPIKPEDANRTFNSKKAWQRFAIAAAGPVSNLLLAILLYACIFMAGTTDLLPVVKAPVANTPAAAAGIEDGDTIKSIDGTEVKTYSDMRFELIKHAGQTVTLGIESKNGTLREKRLDLGSLKLEEESGDKDSLEEIGLSLKVGQPKIREVIANSAGEKAGLKSGDEIVALAGKNIETMPELVSIIKTYPGKPLEFTVVRNNGETLNILATPEAVKDAQGNEVGRIGAVFGVELPKTTVSYGPLRSLYEGAKKTWDTAVFSLEMLWKMLTGEVSVKNLSGPVTIADYAGQTARLGIEPFISFLALVSISLGILNLLPIPMLDGGHLMYYSVEMIKGKPVSEKFQAVAQRVGIAALCGLTFLALFNDFSRLMS